MTRKLNALLVFLLLLLSPMACIIPIVGEKVQNFINIFFDQKVNTPEPALPVIPAPADNYTLNEEIAGAAGTYKGTSTFSDIWVTSFGGKVYLNNFEITIDKTGKITGSIESFWETEESEPMSWEPSPGAALHYCITRMSHMDQGTITGHLLEPDGSRPSIDGLLEFNMSAKKQIFRSDCPADYEENLTYYKTYADIHITGDQLTGSLNDGTGSTPITIKAVRQ